MKKLPAAMAVLFCFAQTCLGADAVKPADAIAPAAQGRGRSAPNSNDVFYTLGPDSRARDGVPRGKYSEAKVIPSLVFPGTQQCRTAATTTAAREIRTVIGSIKNVRLMNALTKKGYDLNYTWGIGNHGQKQGGAIFPEMMRWLWRDQPVSTDPNDQVERSFRHPATSK